MTGKQKIQSIVLGEITDMELIDMFFDTMEEECQGCPLKGTGKCSVEGDESELSDEMLQTCIDNLLQYMALENVQ